MTDEAFTKNWMDLTARPGNFQKLDCILKNPAPAHIPPPEVIKQIANFMKQSLNLKTLEGGNGWKVRAAGLA